LWLSPALPVLAQVHLVCHLLGQWRLVLVTEQARLESALVGT
jgi:hypothetical protein